MSLRDQNITENVRVLDIDGVYLVSILVHERATNIFLDMQEIAFGSMKEAGEYLMDEYEIDILGKVEEEDWGHYDYQ